MAGFSPRKAKTSLYVAPGDSERDALLATFGKHTSGRACVYINKVDDIDMDVFKNLLTQSVTFLLRQYPEN